MVLAPVGAADVVRMMGSWVWVVEWVLWEQNPVGGSSGSAASNLSPPGQPL